MTEFLPTVHKAIGSRPTPTPTPSTHTQRKEETKYKLLSQKGCCEFKAS